MGFLTKTADKRDDLIDKLVDKLDERQQDQQKFVEKVIDVLVQQQDVMQKLLGQYVASGQNQSSGLDRRLFKKEQEVVAPEWEPIGNPFEGM